MEQFELKSAATSVLNRLKDAYLGMDQAIPLGILGLSILYIVQSLVQQCLRVEAVKSKQLQQKRGLNKRATSRRRRKTSVKAKKVRKQ